MSFPKHVFKPLDIRGLVDSELSEEFFYRLGRAAVVHTGARHVYVGYDMRPSSIPYKNALIKGLTAQGADVTDIGLCSKPTIFIMSLLEKDSDLGMMVTASHNPSEYNGCKLVEKKSGMQISLDNGLDSIRSLMDSYDFVDATRLGKVEERDIRREYVDYIYSCIDTSSIKPMRIAIDFGNGIQGVVIDELLGRLSLTVTSLYKEPDGTFPNHEANPLKYETLRELQDLVVKNGLEVGFAYDGDADRIGMVDERGQIVTGDLMLALLATAVLKDNPGSAIIYESKCSRVVKEVIDANGGRGIEAKVGTPFIVAEMNKYNGVLGGEVSCHFYWKELFNFEGDLTLLYLLKIICESGKPVSELVAPLRKYFPSGEFNFEIEDKDGVLRRLEEKYAPDSTHVSHLDGIKIEFKDWWFNARKSNTEPLLRFSVEADTKELLDAKVAEIRMVVVGG